MYSGDSEIGLEHYCILWCTVRDCFLQLRHLPLLLHSRLLRVVRSAQKRRECCIAKAIYHLNLETFLCNTPMTATNTYRQK